MIIERAKARGGHPVKTTLAVIPVCISLIACGGSAGTSSPDGTSVEPTGTAVVEESPSSAPTEAPTDTPDAGASPMTLSGRFTLETDPSLQTISAGGECVIAANDDWFRFNLLSPADGSTLFSLVVGRTEDNPDGESLAGGGTVSADSIVVEGNLNGGTAIWSPDAEATVSADLRTVSIEGVAAAGNQSVAYTYTVSCS